MIFINVKASGPHGSIAYKPWVGSDQLTEPQRRQDFDEAESAVREDYEARFGCAPEKIDLEVVES